ncbi:signal peptidase I [Natronincola peptidivorans]|uniref:Signal peptidase I n=1 Tax=Natronincola peptidivorans TaxID=426128 RepID=A0A1I0DM65_9FIRM|nr:signal peptidase I [Natronincola peptidivorans]SET32957.1 signal peptidase I [Natronincola peptidivorans]
MKNINSNYYRLLKIVIVVLLLFFIVDYYVLSVAIVEGDSMYPTINPSNRLLFVKLPYFKNNLKRGDMIIFEAPEELNRDELFVKRVIALEDDQYLIDEGVLFINNKEVTECYVCDEEYLCKDYPYTEGVVGKSTVFVLGDNRNNSNDSRRFCCVKKDKIIGKVLLRIWPLNEIKVFMNPTN